MTDHDPRRGANGRFEAEEDAPGPADILPPEDAPTPAGEDSPDAVTPPRRCDHPTTVAWIRAMEAHRKEHPDFLPAPRSLAPFPPELAALLRAADPPRLAEMIRTARDAIKEAASTAPEDELRSIMHYVAEGLTEALRAFEAPPE